MGGGGALGGGVIFLIEPEAVPVLLMVRRQGLVYDGNPHAPAGDSPPMEGPEAQAGVLPQIQKPRRVKALRQLLRPLGPGVKIPAVRRLLQARQIQLPEVRPPEIAGGQKGPALRLRLHGFLPGRPAARQQGQQKAEGGAQKFAVFHDASSPC